MAKEIQGYVYPEKHGDKKSRWFARYTYTDGNGKRRNVKKLMPTETKAAKELARMIDDFEKRGDRGARGDRLTFNQLAADYEKTKLIEAEYRNGKKIKGRRSLNSAKVALKVLQDYFGHRRVRYIRHDEIEEFKHERLDTPTQHGGERQIASVNRELELMRAILRFAVKNDYIIKSPDSYEVRLAHYAAQDDWSDQEITNLVIAFRRKHGERMASSAAGYHQILARARLDGVEATAVESLKIISTLVGVEICNIQRYKTDPPCYVLELGNNRVVQLGGVASLIEQNSFRKVLIDYGNYNMPVFKASVWHDIVTRMLNAIEEVQAPFESTRLGAATNWLKSYVRDFIHPERVKEAQWRAVLDHKPGLIDGVIWFSMSGFKKYVQVEFTEHPQPADLAVWLKQIGCQFESCKTIRIGAEESRVSRSLWMVSAKLFPPDCPNSLIA